MLISGAHTLARLFDSLEGVDAVSQIIHGLGCEVFRGLDLQ